MSLTNTSQTYGGVAKSLHWLTVALIFTLIPLGIVANGMPYDTSDALAQKAFLFSIHKTLGVLVFFVALARITWAFSQPKPRPLHPDRKLETLAAETVHWALYAALLVVPLSGWIHHAATTGFAPIWWPFGQSLPFVPKSESLAHTFASLHIIFERVLVVSLILHIAGALKHRFVDRDITLQRMLPGVTAPATPLATHRSSALPVIGAMGGYGVALAIGASLGLFAHTDGPAVPQQALAEVASDWQVETGTLEITVNQLGNPVTGRFEDWTAAISYDDATRTGDVSVTIAIASLTLGSVTGQALGAEFFDATDHPTATFTAEIQPTEAGGHVAEGELLLKGTTLPLSLPFDLTISDGVAQMTGATRLARLDFGIGPSYPDEASVGFGVDVSIDLTAREAE